MRSASWTTSRCYCDLDDVCPRPLQRVSRLPFLPVSTGDVTAPRRVSTMLMPVMASSSALRVQLLHPGAVTPSRGSAAAAGYDLAALMAGVVPARGRALLQTGVAIALPSDVYGRIAPRSGLSWKKGLDVGAGVIDADYRGELRVLLFNLTDDDVKIEAGDRIAQLVLERISTPDVVVVESLDSTERGAGGFGSTGTGTPDVTS